MKKWIFFLIVFSLIGLVTAFGFDSPVDFGFGYDTVGEGELLGGHLPSFFMPLNNSVFGRFDFNGGWKSNGLSIIDGDIYAQTGFFFNITSLNVTKQNLTILDDLVLDSFTQGSTLFIGSNSEITEDNSNFFWDDANNRLGIGTTSPDSTLDVAGDFEVNNNNLFVNSSSGFVGIGTANPLFKLDIKGIVSISAGSARIELEDILVNGSDWWILPSTGGTTDLFRIYDRGEDSDRLVINSIGDVGIGTVNPSAQLHIKGSGTDGILLERSLVDQDTEILFTNELEVEKWAIHFDGSSPEDLFIYPEVLTQDLILQINETGTAFGNVGIGTISPVINLHLVTSGSSGLGSTPTDRGIAITGIGGKSRIYFEATDAPSNERVFVISNAGGILAFGSLNNTASAFINENIFTLDHDTGNVGIGTSSPQNTLNVIGDGNFTGNLFIGQNITLTNGGVVFDNSTCTFLVSPDGSSRLEVCNV